MPFIWNSNPNAPARELPTAVPPGEVSYEVALVANTVNAGGTLLYNTANVSYDVVYELASLNVNALNVRSFNSGLTTADIPEAANGPLYFTVARARSSISNTAPINYDSNTGIISHAVSGVTAATYGNTTVVPVVTVDATGHVTSVTNTNITFPSGSGGSQGFRNLWMGTHPGARVNNSQILLRHADEIVMDDGERVSNWNSLVANIEVSGAGGLDTGSETSSVWYEIYAIRQSSGGTKSILLHRALDRHEDQGLDLYSVGFTGGAILRTTIGTRTQLSQSFTAGRSGPLTGCEFLIGRTGVPAGVFWITLESDDGVGNASGSILSTSRLIEANSVPNPFTVNVRFVFDTPFSVSSGSIYHLVLQGDYPIDVANYLEIFGKTTTDVYVGGEAKEFVLSTNTWITGANARNMPDNYFKTFVESNSTAVSMPSGYDQKALISYVYNDSAGNFKNYQQRDRVLVMGPTETWKVIANIILSSGGVTRTVDVQDMIPPNTSLVQFSVYSSSGADVFIGGVHCLDLPATISGSGIVALLPGTAVCRLPAQGVNVMQPIVVEQQAICLKQSLNNLLNVHIGTVTF